MSAWAGIVRFLIGKLTADERSDIVRDLIDVADPGPTDLSIEVEPAVLESPDWDYVWRALIDTSTEAGHIKATLSSPRSFFDFAAMIDVVDQLRASIDETYDLMCQAARIDGLRLEVGDDLDTIRRTLGLRRGEIVDIELSSMPCAPAEDAERWTIDYRDHGGFIATRTGYDQDVPAAPWKFWGAAPTADSAAHALRWYFLDRPPLVDFDPRLAASPRPLAPFTVDADLSTEGPSVHDLLARRGPNYDEHVAACVSARARLSDYDDVGIYLAERATELNAHDPQLHGVEALRPIGGGVNNDHGGFANTVQWVTTLAVVSTSCPEWGQFDRHRDETLRQIAEGLLAADSERFTARFFGDEISLVRAPGWAGPLYYVGFNGNHRVHAARMLQLPTLAARVETESIATSWHMIDLVADDGRYNNRDKPLKTRLSERAELIKGMLRRGIIEGEFTDDEDILHCRRLPAVWFLRAPAATAHVNSIYESRYPGALGRLGIPATVAADPEAWTAWLR